MGLYDRPYYQEDSPQSPFASSGRTMIMNLIIINAVVFFIDAFFLEPSGNGLTRIFSVQSSTLLEPWNWWRFLTYGFMHDPNDAFHVIGNMLGLYFLGQAIEQHYGPKRFLKMYLTSLVFCSLVWGITETIMGGGNGSLIGASGAVTTVVILFALNYPKRTVLLMMFIPMPAWVLGVLIVVMNLFGNAGGAGMNARVAYDVHLMGALYGFIFFKTGWAIGGSMDGQAGWLPKFRLPKARPKLKVHNPGESYTALDRQADVVLDKLHREGVEALSPKERKVLEDYSRRMKQKHR